LQNLQYCYLKKAPRQLLGTRRKEGRKEGEELNTGEEEQLDQLTVNAGRGSNV